MSKLHDIMKETVTSINATTNLFYQYKDEEGYNQLNKTLVVISDLITAIHTSKSQGLEVKIEDNKILEVLRKAMNAMEGKDMILMSDILQYELIELIEKSML